jgi:hypothetical protein
MKKNKFILVALFLFILTTTIFSADRALVIGIDDYKNENINPIQGGIADAQAMQSLLQKRFGFSSSSIRPLLGSQATAFGIKDSVKTWLIQGTKPGDRVFFFYSGHGARVADQDGDETEDQRDEVIAPYDVEVRYVGDKPQPNNFIRDDEVNEWIGALAGRQIVMVFDSCNSGTISRDVGKVNSKFVNLEAIPPTTRSMTDEVRSPLTRDMSTVIDKYMDNKTPNVVVISAAQANQTATWLDTNGSKCKEDSSTANYRGALAYLFEKAYEKDNPTLSQLNNYITNEMVRLQDAKIMCKSSRDEYQKPLLEYNSAMANKTLFGMQEANLVPNWEDSALTALQNPLGKLGITIRTDDSSTNYKVGETIHYSVNIKQSAYIYVVVFSRNDVATVIFPYTDEKTNKQVNNFLNAGVNKLPDGEAACPEGKDIWVTIASKKPISGLENLPFGTEYKWQEVLDKIGTKDLQTNLETIAKTRGVVPASTKLSAEDWQTATMTTYTIAGNKPCQNE